MGFDRDGASRSLADGWRDAYVRDAHADINRNVNSFQNLNRRFENGDLFNNADEMS